MPAWSVLLRYEFHCPTPDALRCRCRASISETGVALIDSAIQTLTAQHTDFDFHHVQPTLCFGV